MTIIAVYNMKGGVGKTTTAVNLSYLAAASGRRTLLWDLDPQAASSFAFRVRSRVAGFGKKSLERARGLAEAIKETDYRDLDLLPADFAYRKLDRLLDHLGKPERVMTDLLEVLGHDYDIVFLDCPAGFSLVTEGIFAAADAILVPTIPTPLSLRTLARLLKWADRSDSSSQLATFFSMVDRRKTLHRRACEWSADHTDIFLTAQVPYASVVEHMAVKRMPLPVFAARDAATAAFAALWIELQTRLQQTGENPRPRREWPRLLRTVESLVARLESADGPEQAVPSRTEAVDSGGSDAIHDRRTTEGSRGPTDRHPRSSAGDVQFVHRFDTGNLDLQRCGYVLELRDGTGNFVVIAAQSGGDDDTSPATRRAEAQIDSWWAMQILSGMMSPLTALERRLGASRPWLLEHIGAIVGAQKFGRVDSRMAQNVGADRPEHAYPLRATAQSRAIR